MESRHPSFKASQELSLAALYEVHSGKVGDKWSSYLGKYDRLFLPFLNRPVNFLEIGVQNGGSLEIFASYFRNAKRIIGCDIDPECGRLSFADDRIKVVIGDITSPETKTEVASILCSEELDIIIDDGSHKSGDIIRAFCLFFPLLRCGGLYIIEDLCASYWKSSEGGLLQPLSSISFLKYLVDVIHYEHWRLNKPRTWLLRDFIREHALRIDDYELAKISSLEFYNSLCVVHKARPEEVLLGTRMVGGAIAPVAPDVTPERLRSSSVHDIEGLPGEVFPTPLEMARRMEALEDKVKRLSAELSVVLSAKAAMEMSEAWRIGHTISRIGNVAFPQGSVRRRVLALAVRASRIARQKGVLALGRRILRYARRTVRSGNRAGG
jgi:hypothetical protein